MILRILGSPWALVAVWILGPAILIAIRQRNKRRDEEAARAAKPGAVRAAPTTPVPGREQTGVTRVPGSSEVHPGFRDLRWGDAPAADMELVSQNAEEAVYARHGELLRVEDVPVAAIQYIFSSGHFAAVRVDAPLHAGDPLLKALSQRWGSPDTQDPRALKQQWTHLVSGPMATAALLEKNPVSHRTTLFVFRKADKRPTS